MADVLFVHFACICWGTMARCSWRSHFAAWLDTFYIFSHINQILIIYQFFLITLRACSQISVKTCRCLNLLLNLQLFSYIVILPNLMDTDELDPLIDIYFLALCASLFYTTLCIHISKFGSEDFKKIKGIRPCKLHPDEIR